MTTIAQYEELKARHMLWKASEIAFDPSSGPARVYSAKIADDAWLNLVAQAEECEPGCLREPIVLKRIERRLNQMFPSYMRSLACQQS